MKSPTYPGPLPPFRPKALSKREQQVFHLMVEGLTNREIADTLGVSHSYIKVLVNRVRQKAGYASRCMMIVAYWKRTLEEALRDGINPS